MIFLVFLAFLYQIIFVWLISYQYQIRYERRLQIMMISAGYCFCSILYYFIHSLARVYLTILIAIVHYHICAFTFIYYTNKIMSILPDTKKKMTKTLKFAHIFQSLVLTIIAIIMLVNNSEDFDGNLKTSLNCHSNWFLAFQAITLFSFLFFQLVLSNLRRKVDQIEVLSKIDRKINYQYKRTIN
jgi:hypothetical protein